MHTFIKIIFSFVLMLMLFAAAPVLASEIRIDTGKSEIHTGEEFRVHIVMHADESLNAIEGRLIFPQEMLRVKEVHDGNSVINFWVEKPHLDSAGGILFSGIAPGGFSGVNNNIFSVVLEAKKTGDVALELHNIKALKNDGLGTEAELSAHNIAVSIEEGDSNVVREKIIDNDLPEDFSPIIMEDPEINDGKKFLVFATQDKISGIDHYEIREGTWGLYALAESPYLLKHQGLNKKIYIKAIDKEGNTRLVVMNANNPAPWYRQYEMFGIILAAILIGLLLKKIWPKSIK